MKKHLSGLIATIGLMTGLVPSSSTWALDYPAEPIKVIVPFPAGGATDLMARSLTQKLSERLGQSIVVENKAGAAGAIAADTVARARPNGYTLLYSTMGVLAINPSLYQKLAYDPQRSFEPVAMTHLTANLLVVHPSVKAENVAQLAELARSEPEALSFSSSGVGSSSHLSGELFKHIANADILHVPYKGTAPAIADFLAGRITIMFDTISNFVEHVKVGKARALGVTSTTRISSLPDVPSISETVGFEQYDVSLWSGILAPAGTPQEIIDFLNKEIVAVMKEPAMADYLRPYGIEVRSSTPQEFAQAIAEDGKKWNLLIKQAGIEAQ